MRILVVGNGGREHAIAWKLSQSRKVSRVYCAPGNAGISSCAECIPVAADDINGLVHAARQRAIDLTVVGPEQPLTGGIVDSFKRAKLRIFGPTKEAAGLEGSKIFAKEFCLRHDIPVARAHTFDDPLKANEYLKGTSFPVVVKADGLASGKGVVICRDAPEAGEAVNNMMVAKCFGEAGEKLIVEEFLEGEEASFIVVCDGNHVLPLASSQDHKRAYDGDAGPNTGGMGAVSPAEIVSTDIEDRIIHRIIMPAVRGMVTEGMPFVGVLYAGLMIKDGEPKLLEFNVRFGDPETQVLLVRMKTDLVDVLGAAVSGRLDTVSLAWDPRPAVCVVMASGGYPGAYEKGRLIGGLDEASAMEDVFVFHAGTRHRGTDIVTDGGRVLGVTALGPDMGVAIGRAYEAVSKISWEGMHYRRDIGRRACEK